MKDKQNDDSLEKLILELVNPHQRKVAFVIAIAMEQGFSQNETACKIYTMCVEEKLKPYGNIVKWRHSEIGLPSA